MKIFLLRLIAVCAIVVVLGWLSGCDAEKYCAKHYSIPSPDTTTLTAIAMKETIHDTTVTTDLDTSWIMAYLECDSNNQALLHSMNEMQGQRSKATADFIRYGSRLQLLFSCRCDSQAIYIAMRSRDTSTLDKTTIRTPYRVEVERKLTWWEQMKLLTGGWTMLSTALLLFSGGLLLKLKKYVP